MGRVMGLDVVGAGRPRWLTAVSAAVLGLVLLGAMVGAAPTVGAATFERDSVRGDGWGIGRDLCVVGPTSKATVAYGVACFEPSGDKLNVADGSQDGFRVGMHWRAGGRSGICVNAQGKEDDYTPQQRVFSGDFGCNKDLPESATIFFRIGRCNASAVNCSVLGNWKNWSATGSWDVGG